MQHTEYSTPLIQITSATTITEQRKEERNKSALTNFLAIAAVGTVATQIPVVSRQSTKIANLFNTNILDATTRETAGMSWNDLFSDPEKQPSHVALEWIRKAEELSPFRILRTLQLSHVMTPFVLSDAVSVDISPQLLLSQESTFRAALETRGEFPLSGKHLQDGFRLQDGKLFEMNGDGSLGRVAMKNARLVMTHFALPKDTEGKELVYANRVASQLHTLYGGGTTDSFKRLVGSDLPPFMVAGGKSKAQVAFDIGIAYARSIVETGGRVWDNPFEQITEMVPGYDGSKLQKVFNKIPTPDLWTGGHYRQPIVKSVFMAAKNNVKFATTIGSLVGINELLSAYAPEDSALSRGIIPAMATVAANASIEFSELWSDGLQDYKNAQEFYAPGSTSLMTLAGVPLALGTAAATSSYFKRIYDNTVSGIEVSERNAERMLKVFPDSIGKIMPNKMSDLKMNRTSRYGWRGVAIGTALQLPFIPGALIGRSSQEKIDEYSGKTDVAIRKNRWWFTGSGAYEGDAIKYFDKSWYAKIMAETSTRSLYGDAKTKAELSPLLNPLDYLRDPYRFEKMHEDDRPYPVWGMDVSTGSFLGKLYEKTIGSIIKPDIINPRLASELPDVEQGSVLRGTSGISTEGSVKRALDTGTFSVSTPVSAAEASLIEEGKLLAPAAATYEPNEEAVSWSWGAFKDFVGLKGWMLGLAEESVDLPTSQLAPQLARSGEMTNMANNLKDANLGGLFGLTEPQRRYIPTSAGLSGDRINPLKNNMPSWLPGQQDRHWLDLQTGDPFSKIENGASRLPGEGYASLHKELEGVSAEDYPDIYKFKILSDVAMGSDAYYDARNRVEKAEEDNTLTDYESQMLGTIRDQESKRGVKRQFSEYRTEEELSGASYVQRAANLYWESMSHNTEKALPTEFLTFFRPAGKLIHKRTAIEDYERTQLEGADTAIWDKPVSNFLKPAVVSAIRLVDGEYITDEIKDKRNIDEYFDTLEYVKQRELYKEAVDSGDTESARTARAAYQKTTEGALVSGLDTDREILRSYISLPSEEKAYFSSFINANKKDREKILDITPGRIGQLYKSIWARKDIMDSATENGQTAIEANQKIKDRVAEEDRALRDINPDEYKEWLNSKNRKASTFREFLGDKRAKDYIVQTTGMPPKNFSGWDPRIDMNRIKLRSLTIGKEDFFKFGFWKQDEEELQRYVSVMDDETIEVMADRIAEDNRRKIEIEDSVAESLYREGFIVDNISLIEGDGDVDINIKAL